MFTCEGRVTTLWACALVKVADWRASPSRNGVRTFGFPAYPSASARSVSIVTSMMSGDCGRSPACSRAHAAVISSARRVGKMRRTFGLLNDERNGDAMKIGLSLCPNMKVQCVAARGEAGGPELEEKLGRSFRV